MFNKKALALTGLSMLGNVMHINATIKSTSTVVTVKKAEKSTARRVAENIATSPVTHLALAVLIGQAIDAGVRKPPHIRTIIKNIMILPDGPTASDFSSLPTSRKEAFKIESYAMNYNPIETFIRYISYSHNEWENNAKKTQLGNALFNLCKWI